MTDLKQQVRDAFDAVELPDHVKEQTLAALDRLAADEAPAAQPPAKARIVRPRWPRVLAACAACLAVALVGVFGTRLYFEETAYIDIDVNPSVELGVNRFDIVVSATALNDDGANVLSSVSVEGKRYEEAVGDITSSAAFNTYIYDDSYIEISVSSDDSRQSEVLRAQSDACLSRLSYEGSCHASSVETRNEAAAVGMGVGRYQAARYLMEIDPTATWEECSTLSMRELRDRIAQSEESSSEEDSRGGKGHGEMGSMREEGGHQGGMHGRQS